MRAGSGGRWVFGGAAPRLFFVWRGCSWRPRTTRSRTNAPLSTPRQSHLRLAGRADNPFVRHIASKAPHLDPRRPNPRRQYYRKITTVPRIPSKLNQTNVSAGSPARPARPAPADTIKRNQPQSRWITQSWLRCRRPSVSVRQQPAPAIMKLRAPPRLAESCAPAAVSRRVATRPPPLGSIANLASRVHSSAPTPPRPRID